MLPRRPISARAGKAVFSTEWRALGREPKKINFPKPGKFSNDFNEFGAP